MINTKLLLISIGSNGSVDDQAIGFHSCHADKQKIKYKREEDRFIADCLCDNGFICLFYFRNIPSPQKHLRLKLLVLHSQVLALFDTLPHKYYKYWVDNLCTSVNFLIYSLKHKACIMVKEV